MGKITDSTVFALPVLIGNRYYNHRDFEEFSDNYRANGFIPICCDYYGDEYQNLDNIFVFVSDQLVRRMEGNPNPFALFLIISWRVAGKTRKVLKFIKSLKQIPNLHSYTLVWGEGGIERFFFGSPGSKLSDYLFERDYANYLYFHHDAPTAGARRICEFIQRIMGYDLPGETFPDYCFEDVKKIAFHINHESFNSFSAASDSVPKYNIVDGRPHFPVISAEVSCPICRKKHLISRYSDFDPDGAVAIRCFGSKQCNGDRIIIPGAKSLFATWPEFDEYRKRHFRNGNQ